MKKITLLVSFIVCVVFAQAQTTLFSENFNNVTTTAVADANGNTAATRDIGTALVLDSAIVTNPGWVGSKVYVSNGKLKLGTSSVMGFLTTAPINLSGSFTVTADLASWNNTGNVADTGSSIDVQVDGVVVATLAYTTTMATYTTPVITAKTATSKITFTAKVGKNRFYIDNILVASATLSGTSSPKSDVLSVSLAGKTLSVKDVADGSILDIYSAVGAKVQSAHLINGAVQLNNLSKGLYIVRIGNMSTKIMM